MYNPPDAGGQYVELYNNSTNFTFDLSGWQFQGLSYTFPAGSLIGPNSFLVLAANGAAFAALYGATNPVFDTFGESVLATNGPTILALIQPGPGGSNNTTVAEVLFDSAPPWPAGANGLGSSLQLTDPTQDNWRVGNWSGGLSAFRSESRCDQHCQPKPATISAALDQRGPSRQRGNNHQ